MMTRLGIFFFLIFLLMIGSTIGMISAASRDLPDIATLNRFQPNLATVLYASDGTLIGKVYSEDRVPLIWNEVPKNLRNAIVATEDARFYSHFGIDIRGILRAVISDVFRRGIVEGGSTITQQLARNLFLSQERSLTRKIKEAILAIEIERRFSKDEILLMYLNQVYFGAGAYGAQSAAQTYFGKPASRLDLAECALLAGLPQAPSAYSPYHDLAKAKARQQEVLRRMVDQDYITKAEARAAGEEQLHFSELKDVFQGLSYPYFTTYAVEKLFEKYPASVVYTGGLKVYTTMNVKDEEYALAAVRMGIDRAAKEHMNVGQSALVSVEPKTGYIRAMVGGYQFSKDNQFNRAWQARRQPGSSFKIFVYSCAIDHGFRPDSIVYDSPVSYPSGQGMWSPRDDDLRFWGAMPLVRALAYSRNVAAVRVAAQLGIDNVIEYAHRMGVDEPLDPYLPTAIGASVVTPVEMATAAVTLSNEGIRVNPTPIAYVEDRNGNVIEDHRIPTRVEAISAQTARVMTGMLQDVIKYGTGTRANIGRPAAGKTGTASEFRDSWFVGYTPDLATVVWAGNDDFSKMHEGYGGYIPAMIWADYMKKALAGVPPHPFTAPAPIKKEEGSAKPEKASGNSLKKEPSIEPIPGQENPDIQPQDQTSQPEDQINQISPAPPADQPDNTVPAPSEPSNQSPPPSPPKKVRHI